MSSPKIAFIGAGNMANAMIGGLIDEGFSIYNISASGPNPETLYKVAGEFGITVNTDNAKTASKADVVVLSVKPQKLKEVALGLAGSLDHKPLIISVAAGITTASLANWLGADQSIVRAMPNTPAQLREGATGLFANANTTSEQKELADSMLRAVGLVQWLDDESLINSVTAVSGSGPAYFFLVMEAMIDAGVELGLSRKSASKLTLQTALGAAILATQSNGDIAELRRQVTSPNGTTEQAIKSFENDQIRAMFSRAMSACSNRALELSELLGE